MKQLSHDTRNVLLIPPIYCGLAACSIKLHCTVLQMRKTKNRACANILAFVLTRCLQFYKLITRSLTNLQIRTAFRSTDVNEKIL